MFFKSMARRSLTVLCILGAWVIAGPQTRAAERQSLPPRGSEKYWLAVDELADRAVHFAYAKRFVQLHEGLLTDRQCQQYARIAANYADQLAMAKPAGLPAQNGFWNDVREYSISMIGPAAVPIPVHRTSNYSVTTGSEAEDRELRRIVSLEIDKASSQFAPTSEYSTSALKPNCQNSGQGPTAKAQP